MRVLLLLCAACGAVTPRATDDLVGLWGAEAIVTQQTSGHLELRGHDDAWTATIAGISAPLKRDGDWLRADLGTGEVRFRPDRHEGFWLQAGGQIGDVAYAMPLALHGGDPITAEVTPLPDAIRIYIDITSPTTAWIREPGQNIGHFVGALTIARHGNAITFTGKHDQVVAHGTLGPRGLHLAFDRAQIELDLTRRGRGDAPGFYPRADTTYTERVPAAGDGWDSATLASVGMRAEPIHAWIQTILDAVPTSAESPAIHALVIARHGKLVVDEYFDGYTADTPHDTRSSGKSWGTTLVGIHIDRGELALSTPIDPARPITLEHVVSMTTGLDCDDEDDKSPGNEDVMQAQHAERDWYRYTLALKSIRAPGERGVYCTGGINLGGYLLGRATHEWIPALFVHDLGEPLGLAHYYMNLMPTEEGYLGGGLQLRPRDFAKLAQLFLDHGVWHGKQIVSADWVTRATAAHASLNTPDDYGFGWWRTTYHVGGHDYAAFYASGNGGQLAIAIPELDVVVAIMSGNYGNARTWRHFVDDDVPRYVIAAITPERSR
jgi:CubicO group peptidase (beta-lactamase class C family)